MELCQVDIVGGIVLGGGGEAKVVRVDDDHSRYCVIAQVVRRATGRAVCLAFADAVRSGRRRVALSPEPPARQSAVVGDAPEGRGSP